MKTNKIPCAHKQCSNYSEIGCELWSECPVFQADNVTPKKDRSKYGAEKVTVLGMDFDSKREARRWYELLRDNTNEGQLVLDTCMGSWTTAVACHKLNRNWIGFELNKDYYEKGKQRYKQFSSQISIWDIV